MALNPDDWYLVFGQNTTVSPLTSDAPYDRKIIVEPDKITLRWDNDNQPMAWKQAAGNIHYPSDINGNRIGTVQGTASGFFQGGGFLIALDINNTTPSAWPNSAYVTKEGTKNIDNKSFKVRASNLGNRDIADCLLLVHDGTNSFRCKIRDLPSKASNTRFLLVNRGATSYKVKTTSVVNQFL